jgi:hypothetical protein
MTRPPSPTLGKPLVSPASDGCKEPVNPDRRVESRRARVPAARLNLRLARPRLIGTPIKRRYICRPELLTDLLRKAKRFMVKRQDQ